MGLSEIAAGIEVTAEQEERGVPTVDDTGVDLVDRLDEHAERLPCTPEAAATVLETYGRGASVGTAAREASVAPMTAAKTLHRCGEAGVSPLGPTGRRIVRDWLAGELARSDALTLTSAEESEFVLAAFVESHSPIPALAEAAEASLSMGGNASVEKRDALAETMTAASDLR